jgi:hypothetical protein
MHYSAMTEAEKWRASITFRATLTIPTSRQWVLASMLRSRRIQASRTAVVTDHASTLRPLFFKALLLHPQRHPHSGILLLR